MVFGKGLLTFFGAALMMTLTAQPAVLHRAHAHNDYEHDRPLYDALEYGFGSVEADVHLVDDTLWVTHDPPASTRGLPTLEAAYLEPLRRRVQAQGGKVYAGSTEPFLLMIDIKTGARETYRALARLLPRYRDILVAEGRAAGPVRIFLSGNRPVEEVLADPEPLVGLDGRPDDLGRGYPPSLMPVVSDHYRRHLSWSGDGEAPAGQKETLQALARRVHEEGKRLRLWASPDTPSVWAFLLDHGADLINTDSLEGLARFMRARHDPER